MENVIYRSNSSLDRGSKIKMLFVGAIMILVSIPGIILIINGNSAWLPVSIGILGLYSVLLIVGLINKPITYDLTNSVIYIKG